MSTSVKLQISNVRDASNKYPLLTFDLTIILPNISDISNPFTITISGCTAKPYPDTKAGWQWTGPLSRANNTKYYANHTMSENFQNLILGELRKMGRLEYMERKYSNWWVRKEDVIDGPLGEITL